MTPEALVETLEARGARIRARGDGALLIDPPGILRDAEREALRAQKTAVAAILHARAIGVDWSRVSLCQLDRVLEIGVPWSDVNLILAPGCRVARELRARKPKPGRVWCVCEVIDLLLTNVLPEDARKIAEAKLALTGTVVGVKTR